MNNWKTLDTRTRKQERDQSYQWYENLIYFDEQTRFN